jgi:hypothetical protein
MSQNYTTLRSFTPDEIIFDDKEIIIILLFFFPGYESSLASFTMNHTMREFAQGLLVEAVDSSEAMGWVHLIFAVGTSRRPGSAIGSALRSFAEKGGIQFLKRSKKLKHLDDLEIYESVRKTIQINFKEHFGILLTGALSQKKNSIASAFVDYATAHKRENILIIWC